MGWGHFLLTKWGRASGLLYLPHQNSLRRPARSWHGCTVWPHARERQLVKVAGADVWKGQWVVIVLNDGAFERGFVASEFSMAMSELDDVVVIGVDIPIGLPTLGERRPSDLEARAFVGPRRSSVFFTPSRELLMCDTAQEANRLAREQGVSGIAAQTFGLKKQIVAVAPWAEGDERIFEVHPEVSFREAAGHVLPWPKSSWNGQMLRRSVLASHGIEIPETVPSLGAAEASDIVDAAIVAWSASRIAINQALPMPLGGGRIGSIWR